MSSSTSSMIFRSWYIFTSFIALRIVACESRNIPETTALHWDLCCGTPRLMGYDSCNVQDHCVQLLSLVRYDSWNVGYHFNWWVATHVTFEITATGRLNIVERWDNSNRWLEVGRVRIRCPKIAMSTTVTWFTQFHSYESPGPVPGEWKYRCVQQNLFDITIEPENN